MQRCEIDFFLLANKSTGWPRRFGLFGAFWMLLCFLAPAQAETRTALVIGNAAYASGTLANAGNDASDIAAKLRGYGFEVELLGDAKQRDMEQAISRFTRTLNGQDKVGLFYFAGHGVEFQGRNYLIPIGAEIRNEVDLKYEAVDAGRVLDGMAQAGNGLNMVILDACRNNPFGSAFRSASRGLTRMTAAKGTLILYATQPGAVAQDGSERNGVFTKHLLSSMDQSGLPVEQMFKQTALAVDRETHGAQTPWIEGVVLGQFAFNASGIPPQPNPPPSTTDSTPPPPPSPAAAQGNLQVNVNAPARIYLDGAAVGQAKPGKPLNLSHLAVGNHRLSVTAAGYLNYETTSRIRQGQWTQEVVSLKPEAVAPIPAPPPPPPVYGTRHGNSRGYLDRYGYVSSPSFRCSGALKPVESIICDDPELARMDGIMGNMYRDLRKVLSPSQSAALRSEQIAWIRERDQVCPVSRSDLHASSRFAQKADCLQRFTEQRIALLWNQLQRVQGD